MSRVERKAKETTMNMFGKTGDEMVGKGKWQYKEFQNKHGG
jgi:hypothetical protein